MLKILPRKNSMNAIIPDASIWSPTDDGVKKDRSGSSDSVPPRGIACCVATKAALEMGNFIAK